VESLKWAAFVQRLSKWQSSTPSVPESLLKVRKLAAVRPGALWPRPTGLDSFLYEGAVAQLGERLICIQEVVGSTPISSTNMYNGPVAQLARAHP
jgi:hypothetical protein